MKIFQNDEKGYLKWVENNQEGYIANIDYNGNISAYPMVHRSTHKSLSSSKIKNYTTGKYFKVCSNDIEELEDWANRNYGKSLNPCSVCMR